MSAVAVAELETRLVAGLLVEPAATVGPVRQVLHPSLIYNQQPRALFDAILSLSDRGEIPGTAGVWGELASSGATPLFPGGIATIEAWGNLLEAPLPAETIEVARKLAELARQRTAQAAAEAYSKEPTLERRATLEGALREQAAAEASAPASLAAPLDYRTLAREGGADVLWQVGGILPQRGIGDLTATSGVGKSWLLLDAAISIAAGELVWGRFEVPRPGPICYFDEENGPEEICRRLTLLEQARGLSGRDLPIFPFCFLGLKLDDPQQLDTLRAILSEYRPVAVFLDSSIRFHGQQENDNSGMAVVTEAMRRLAVDCDTSILAAHHPNKPGQFPRSLVDRGRGAGEIIAGLDTYLFAQQMTDGSIRVDCSKVRRGIPPPPFTLRLDDDPEGGVHISYLGSVEPDDDQKDKARATILTELHGAGGDCDRPTLEAACERAKVKPRTASSAFAELVDLGLIRKGELRARKRMYHLTPAGQEGLQWE